MSYDTNRLRGVHPPACTCVQCSEGRNRGRRRGRGSGNSGNGKRGCLPLMAALSVAALAAVVAAAALA